MKSHWPVNKLLCTSRQEDLLYMSTLCNVYMYIYTSRSSLWLEPSTELGLPFSFCKFILGVFNKKVELKKSSLKIGIDKETI